MELEKYGKRRVWNNPFKKRSGWKLSEFFAKSFKKQLMKLEGY